LAEALPVSSEVEVESVATAIQVEPDLEAAPPSAEVLPVAEPSAEAIAPAAVEEPSAVSESAPEAGEKIIEGADLDAEAAFAWLESLAVRQGAQEALLLKPEERQEQPPGWISEIPIEPEAPAVEAGEETSRVERPEWMPEMTISAEAAPVEGAPVAEPEALPAATEEIREGAVEPALAAPETGVSPVEEVPELPAWLAGAEEVRLEDTQSWRPPAAVKSAAPPTSPLRRYDLNQASLSELERVPGIGFTLAQRIITMRETIGPYESVDDLARVTGMTPTLIEDLRSHVFVEGRRLPVEPEAPVEQPLAEPGEAAPLSPELLQTIQARVYGRQDLPGVIAELQQTLAANPHAWELWQTLGDAYVRCDRLQDALDAYNRAEDLLR
jgi:competence ComEA-like helix-hairpin-helix protein